MIFDDMDCSKTPAMETAKTPMKDPSGFLDVGPVGLEPTTYGL